MKYKNLTLIGTSHIAEQSVDEVKKVVENEKPDLIAIELDKRRLYALLNDDKRKVKFSDIRVVGFKGFLFAMFGSYIQKKLGEQVGISAGSEMMSAVEVAKKNKIKVILIDQDIIVTLRRFSKSFSWKEKWHFAVDLFKGLFFKKAVIKEMGLENIDLSKVPSKKIIKKLITIVKKRYPNIYKVLIEERNYVMANNILKLMGQNPDKKIVAVVGAGHEEGMMKIIKDKQSISYSFSVG